MTEHRYWLFTAESVQISVVTKSQEPSLEKITEGK